jgi:DNA-binding CsgD family transcriptional regulator/tetratricopeptide (TPR) repeat protein
MWERRWELVEGRAQLERILALAPSQAFPAARCSALTGAGVIAALQADYDQATRHCEEALAGWRHLGHQQGSARALLCLSTVARYQDDYARAEILGQEAFAGFRSIDDGWGVGHVLANLGMVAWVQGDHAAGTARYEEALIHLRDIGDEVGIFQVVLELGKGASDAGDLARATMLLEECLALSESMGDRARRGETLNELGVVAQRQEDYSYAGELFTEAATLAQGVGDRRQLAWVTAHHGDVDVATGDFGSAATRYAEALGIFRSMDNRLGIALCLGAIARCAILRERLEAAVRLLGSCASLFNVTGATPPPGRDPVAAAEALRSNVCPESFAEAWESGRSLGPGEAAAEALALAAELSKERHDEVRQDPVATPDGPSANAGDRSSPAAMLGLTPREVEVLRLLAEGMSDREIAAALSISERTAGNHVQHAMQKIGVESRTAAAVYAIRHDLD